MSWAEGREEEKTYLSSRHCHIHMPLIYGEGMKNALRRLQEEINEYLSIDRSKLLPSKSSHRAVSS